MGISRWENRDVKPECSSKYRTSATASSTVTDNTQEADHMASFGSEGVMKVFVEGRQRGKRFETVG